MIARSALRRGAITRSISRATFRTAVSAAGSSSAVRVGEPGLDLDPVGRRVCDRRLDGQRVVVEREHGPVPDLRGRDREDAGAAADVEEAPARLGEQELEAEARRRVRPGAERAAGVDHDRDRAGVGLLPGRADPERADAHRPVECAPAVLPALLDVGRARAAEGRPEPLLPARVRVGDQLDAAGGRPAPRSPPGRARASARGRTRPRRR